MPRLTDRFTRTERQGLLIMLLILAVIILALVIHSAGRQQPRDVIRDTVTIFASPTPTDSLSITRTKPKRTKRTKATDTSQPKKAPTRNPLDEHVPFK